jgi:hypothetical protein
LSQDSKKWKLTYVFELLRWLQERVTDRNKLTGKKAEKIKIPKKVEIKKKMYRIEASQKTGSKMIENGSIVGNVNVLFTYIFGV